MPYRLGLFVAEGFDGVLLGGSQGWVDTEAQTRHDREQQGGQDGAEAEGGRPVGVARDGVGRDRAHNDPGKPTATGEQ